MILVLAGQQLEMVIDMQSLNLNSDFTLFFWTLSYTSVFITIPNLDHLDFSTFPSHGLQKWPEWPY